MDLFTKVKAFQGLAQAWLTRLEGLPRNHPTTSSSYCLKAHCPQLLSWPWKRERGSPLDPGSRLGPCLVCTLEHPEPYCSVLRREQLEPKLSIVQEAISKGLNSLPFFT